MLRISLRLVDLNIYFCDVLFLTRKWVQKGVYRNGFFLLCDRIEVSQATCFYTTQVTTGEYKQECWRAKLLNILTKSDYG